MSAIEATEAAAQITRAGGSGNEVEVDVRVGDVHDLDLPDATYDITHAHQVLQHVVDPVKALQEMARVTRPGGTIAVRESDYSGFTWWPRDPRLDRWMALYQKAARANGGDPDAGRRLLEWANAAGLTKILPSTSAWCLATPTDRDWWGQMWADRIRTSALADQLLDAGWANGADLQSISDAWREWAAHPDGWLTVPSGELLITR